MDMPFPREVLNQLKWKEHDLDGATITYIHRGAPGDIISIGGGDIVELERSFFVTVDSKIPYHRITEIRYRGAVVWSAEVKKEKIMKGI
jgi:uncharacterized protein